MENYIWKQVFSLGLKMLLGSIIISFLYIYEAEGTRDAKLPQKKSGKEKLREDVNKWLNWKWLEGILP